MDMSRMTIETADALLKGLVFVTGSDKRTAQKWIEEPETVANVTAYAFRRAVEELGAGELLARVRAERAGR